VAVDVKSFAQQIAAKNSLTGGANSTSSLTLTPAVAKSDYESLASLIPSRPEYTPYVRQEFDDSPRSGPGSEYGWTWTPGIKSRQIWNQEQDAKAQDALNAYNAKLADWQNMVEILKFDYLNKQQQREKELANLNTQLASMGLTPTTSLDDPSYKLNMLGAQWNAATDQATKDAIHQQAEAIRKQYWGVSGGPDGSLTAKYMTMAGTPTYERQFNEQKYADALAQQAFENELTLAKLAASGSGSSGGSSGGGTANSHKQIFNAVKSSAINEARNKAKELSKILAPQGAAEGAAAYAIELLNRDLPQLDLTSSEYQEIANQVYWSVGLNNPINLSPEKQE